MGRDGFNRNLGKEGSVIQSEAGILKQYWAIKQDAMWLWPVILGNELNRMGVGGGC